MKKKFQAWHVDTPYPNVYVNFIYLDGDQHKTQFMIPNWTDSVKMEAPLEEPFIPIESEKKKFNVSEKWRKYLKDRYGFFLFCFTSPLTSFHRYGYLMATPNYFTDSGCFQISKKDSYTNAGDAIWFRGDMYCHRGLPAQKGKFGDSRRVIFWYSWETGKLPKIAVPDVDFQLNPWTVYSLVNPHFDESLVSFPFIFVLFSLLFADGNCILHLLGGLSSLLSLFQWSSGVNG